MEIAFGGKEQEVKGWARICVLLENISPSEWSRIQDIICAALSEGKILSIGGMWSPKDNVDCCE